MYRKLFIGHTLFERKCDMLVASVFCHCKHLSCCAACQHVQVCGLICNDMLEMFELHLVVFKLWKRKIKLCYSYLHGCDGSATR